MSKEKPKLIVIVGPTASGKSSLAVWVARKFKGEVISADSRQIYRGLDIGSGKITKKEMDGIPHHLLDVVSPKKQFSVIDFQKLAQRAINDIVSRKKLPILVGGTGFWIDTVVFDLDLPAVPPNQKLRALLAKKKAAELLKILRRLDPERAKTIEQKNPRRIIRAIEIAKLLGKVPKIKRYSPYEALWIGLNPHKSTLHRQIKLRAHKMSQAGLVQETKNLLKRRISKKRICEFGFEYRDALDVIEGKIKKDELAERLARDTFDYARRQMSWFKRNPKIYWARSPSHLKGTKIKNIILRFLASPSQRSKF